MRRLAAQVRPNLPLFRGSLGLPVADQVALRDAELRDWMAKAVLPVFLEANKWTLIALGVLVVLDEINLIAHLAGGRIVTEKVIMALLGATTVQVGAIAYAMAR